MDIGLARDFGREGLVEPERCVKAGKHAAGKADQQRGDGERRHEVHRRPARAVSTLFSGRPPTCMVLRASPCAGTRLTAPIGTPSTRIIRLSPARTAAS